MWRWILASYKDGYKPLKRFQHTANFFNNFLIVLGGRNGSHNINLPIEIYDTMTGKWVSFSYFNAFRHTAWIVDNIIYIYGGFKSKLAQNIQSDVIKINLIQFFNSNEFKKKK